MNEETPVPASPAQNQYLVPASIVLAGAFIAVALYFSNGGGASAGGGTGAPAGLGTSLYTALAKEVGVNKKDFAACVEARRHQQKITDDSADAAAAGGTGTPYSVVLAKDGKAYPINGALPFAAVKVIIDGALAGNGDIEQLPKETVAAIRPVTDADHIRGSSDAPITIIEYSDFQCPFCIRFHPTMLQVMAEYEGRVRWVYRHLPLTAIHPEAEPAALAAECAGELGGNDAFWQFADGLFANQ